MVTTIKGPYTHNEWRTMLLLREGLEYMNLKLRNNPLDNTSNYFYKRELEKDNNKYKNYLKRALSNT